MSCNVPSGVHPSINTTPTPPASGTVSEIVKGDLKPGDEVIVDVIVGGKAAGTGSAAPRMGRMF